MKPQVLAVQPAQNETGLELSKGYAWGPIVAAFIAALDVKPSSKGLYTRVLSLFTNWATDRGYDLGNISRAAIILYKEELLQTGKTARTVSSYLSAVRALFKWVETNSELPNTAKGVSNPKVRREFKKQPLTPDEGKRLLSQYHIKGENALRDFALVNLLLRTGIRTIEAASANVGDINFKGGRRVLYIKGKGRDEKDSFVILTDKTYEPIRAYLESRGTAADTEPLFVSKSNNSKGAGLTTRSVSCIAKEALKAIGLNDKAYTAHSLRHSAGTNILRAGGKLEDVQGVLRHSDPATTLIYVKTFLEGEYRIKNAPEALLDNVF